MKATLLLTIVLMLVCTSMVLASDQPTNRQPTWGGIKALFDSSAEPQKLKTMGNITTQEANYILRGIFEETGVRYRDALVYRIKGITIVDGYGVDGMAAAFAIRPGGFAMYSAGDGKIDPPLPGIITAACLALGARVTGKCFSALPPTPWTGAGCALLGGVTAYICSEGPDMLQALEDATMEFLDLPCGTCGDGTTGGGGGGGGGGSW